MQNLSGFSSFDQRKGQENFGLNKILDYLTANSIQYDNVTNNRIYFEKDVDIVITTEQGTSLLVELKSDDWIGKTGNFFFEIISNEATGTIGCFLKSQAHVWFYLDNKNNILYIFPLARLQKWFFDIRGQYVANMKEIDTLFRLQSTHTKRSNQYGHTTIGRIVGKNMLFKSLNEKGISYIEKHILKEPITLGELTAIL